MAETTSNLDDMVELSPEVAFRGGGLQTKEDKHVATSQHDSEVTPVTKIGPVAEDSPQSHGEDNDNHKTTETIPILAPTASQRRMRNDSVGEAGGSLSGSARKPRSRIGKLYRRSASGRILVRPTSEKHVSPINQESPQDPGIEAEDVSWKMVATSCCCHSATEWVRIAGFMVLLLAVLYFFLVGLDLLSTGFKVAQ
jgi:hypothetical protein